VFRGVEEDRYSGFRLMGHKIRYARVSTADQEIAASCAVTPMTIYRNIRTISAAPSEEATATP
jgi:hypothetical protein